MSALTLSVLAARLSDLLAEARDELDEDAYGDFIFLAVTAISKLTADKIERGWQS